MGGGHLHCRPPVHNSRGTRPPVPLVDMHVPSDRYLYHLTSVYMSLKLLGVGARLYVEVPCNCIVSVQITALLYVVPPLLLVRVHFENRTLSIMSRRRRRNEIG